IVLRLRRGGRRRSAGRASGRGGARFPGGGGGGGIGARFHGWPLLGLATGKKGERGEREGCENRTVSGVHPGGLLPRCLEACSAGFTQRRNRGCAGPGNDGGGTHDSPQIFAVSRGIHLAEVPPLVIHPMSDGVRQTAYALRRARRRRRAGGVSLLELLT